MQQVAVRHVQLDRLQAAVDGAPGGGHEGFTDTGKPCGIEFLRRQLARRVRQGRRSEREPTTLLHRNLGASFPRHPARGLAPGMG